jgi:TPR repeat protein
VDLQDLLKKINRTRLDRGAKQGDAWCQFLLGWCYHRGIGVKPDDYEAAVWLRESADQGHQDAQYLLGNFYTRQIEDWDNVVFAYKWLALSAAQGNEAAQRELEVVAKRMTPDQIDEGRKLVTEWEPKRNKRRKGFKQATVINNLRETSESTLGND